LINAIYFKGIWAKEFDPELTREEAFTDYQNKKGKAQMMHQTLSVAFRETEEYKAVRLPYGEGEAAMYIILPREGLGLNEFLDTLTLDKWETIIGSMVTEKIELAIPKFKMSYGVKRLNDALMRVGMEKIFYSGSLMNIMDDPRLFVEYVDHKAVIEVDEKGTRAAAVTIISIGKSAYERPKEFIADRPFFFVIRDEKSGMILFMGKVLSL
ncbi:MAG TPA: serpin family protein, partial [Firmicutes bacterium]|nr:serpin family protein [Bacillota bacterium]